MISTRRATTSSYVPSRLCPFSLSPLPLTAVPSFQEIRCTDANGQPGPVGQSHAVDDDCRGEFIRHTNGSSKAGASDVMMQSLAEILQKNYAANHASMLIEEAP